MPALTTTFNLSRPACWLIGCLGILVLSPDSLLLRLVDAEQSAVVSIRAIFSNLTLLLFIAAMPMLRHNFRWRPVLIYGLCYAVGLACFPLSIHNTHVANTLVIISAAPMIAAIGAYFILREKTRPVTWLAALIIFLGMLAIFFNNIGSDGLWGDFLALLVAVSLAATSIVVRRYPDTAIYPGLIVGGTIVALLFGFDVSWGEVSGRDWAILAVDGAIVMTVSFLLIVTAARGLPPAELNLIFLIETILGPFWVWLVLHEAPPATTFAAGALIIIVLALHAMWLRSAAAKY